MVFDVISIVIFSLVFIVFFINVTVYLKIMNDKKQDNEAYELLISKYHLQINMNHLKNDKVKLLENFYHNLFERLIFTINELIDFQSGVDGNNF